MTDGAPDRSPADERLRALADRVGALREEIGELLESDCDVLFVDDVRMSSDLLGHVERALRPGLDPS